ncbi:MAG: hypothetical protein Q9168_006484 [Polycauliona sp. 1 TL-2023]
MHLSNLSTIVALFAALGASQRLSKPPLQDNLDNLKPGFTANLKPVASTRTPYRAGYMPADCKKIAQNEKQNPADFQVWNVKYSDCSAEWQFCYHKNSNGPLNDLIDRWGRLPVHTRQFSRHVLSIPSANGYAYNSGGNIVFFGTTLGNLGVHVHEAAHSLDLLGAFSPDKPLSSSQKWLNEYNQDSAVPDPYAQTNQVENVAQNTAVTTYERNVPGGFFGLNPNANRIFHQYATIDTEQRETQPPNLLVVGGTCTGRLANSAPVLVSGSARARSADKAPEAVEAMRVPEGLHTIEAKEFSTKETCKFH